MNKFEDDIYFVVCGEELNFLYTMLQEKTFDEIEPFLDYMISTKTIITGPHGGGLIYWS